MQSRILWFWITWIGFSNEINKSNLIVGIVISFVVYKLFKEKRYSFKPIQSIYYIIWLLREIVKSTYKVTKAVWRPKLDIKPAIGWVEGELSDPEVGIVFANSITLTPGTCTIEAKRNMLVHSLWKKDLISLNEIKIQVEKL